MEKDFYIPFERSGFEARKTGNGAATSHSVSIAPCPPFSGGRRTDSNSVPTPEYTSGNLEPMKADPRPFTRYVKEVAKKGPKDTDSWKNIRRSGSIKMTPHAAGVTTIENFTPIFQVNATPFGAATYSSHQETEVRKPECRHVVLSSSMQPFGEIKGLSEDIYRTDIDSVFNDIPYLADFRTGDPDVSDLILDAMTSVVNDQRSTYDLLTEIGEFSETSRTILRLLEAAKHPMKEMSKLYKEFKRQPFKVSASKWMEYRYALMPIYYSINDALKLMRERNDIYKTSRFSGERAIEFPERDMTKPHLYNSGSMTVRVSATGKSRYSVRAQKLLAQTAFNPFITAWELTKFSWMVDWFINVGDFIGAKLHQYLSLADEESYCYSIKVDGVLNTRLYIPFSTEVKSVPITHYSPLLFKDSSLGFKPHSIIVSKGCDVLLQTKNVNTYSRHTFKPGDINLAFNPYLNWKRGLDALSLASNKISSSYRRQK